MSKGSLAHDRLVNIVNTGIISDSDRGEGRMIPVLILNTVGHDDITELFRVHEHLPPGDVITQWLWSLASSTALFLRMKYLKPMSCEFTIVFDTHRHVSAIDGILHSQAVYLQSGKEGDTLSSTMQLEAGTASWVRILAEVPRMDFFDVWNKRILKILSKRFREHGLNRHQRDVAAHKQLNSMRQVWGIRRD